MKEIIKKRNFLFWGGYFIYLIATVFQTTMFNENAVLFTIFVAFRYMAFFIAGVKVLLDLIDQFNEENRNGDSRHYETIGCFIKYLFIFLLLFIVSFIADERSLLFVFVFLLASRHVEFEKILKYTLGIQIILAVLILAASCIGIIPDLLFDRSGVFIRHALGYIYPSVAVNYFYFIITILFWVRKNPLELKDAFLLEIINFFIFLLTDVKTGFGLITIIIIAQTLRRSRVQSYIDGLMQKNVWWSVTVRNIARHLYDYCAVYLSLILVILCSTIQYKPTQFVNRLLTSRIQLVVDAVKNYGIHMLGKNIEWIGYGGNTDVASFEGIYNFVDSSYASVVLNYGIIVFIGILVLLVLTGKALRKKGNYNGCFLYFMMLVYCFIEPRLIEIQVNTLLFLTAPLLYCALPVKDICNFFRKNIVKK